MLHLALSLFPQDAPVVFKEKPDLPLANTSFMVLKELEKFDEALLHLKYSALAKFTPDQRNIECLAFLDTVEVNPNEEGFLFACMKTCEELGVFKVLHKANLCADKEIPIIRCGNGFLEEYRKDVIRIRTITNYCNYSAMYYFTTEEYAKAFQLLDDLLNAERVVTTHLGTWKVLEKIASSPKLPEMYRVKIEQLKNEFQEAKAIHRAQLEAK